MANLLMPGRQIITTKFQEEYLKDICRTPISQLDLYGDFVGSEGEVIDEVIFAITSANKSNSRYNPLSLADRAIGVDRFMRPFYDFLDVSYDIAEIPHYQPTDKFAQHVISHCNLQLEGNKITPENTIVFSSTESVVELFRDCGYAIACGEWDPKKGVYTNKPPRDILDDFMESGREWFEESGENYLSEAHYNFWQQVPRVPDKIIRIANEPLLTEEGSITETRSYSVYLRGMANSDILDMKYNDVKDAVVSGRIVDEGCADGALLERVSDDFPDSDLIGIEITSEFKARFEERIRAGVFGGTFVDVYQRNIMDPVFEDNSIDTVLCNSTTHEIYSYGDGEDSLYKYLQMKYDQLKPGGRLVIRDVVGPKDSGRNIAAKLRTDNGKSNDPNKVFAEDERKEYAAYLKGLSTRGRFERFAREYLHQRDDYSFEYTTERHEGEEYIIASYKDMTEFMTKKDYTDNWYSELQEEFAFWDITDWRKAAEAAGFAVVADTPNQAGTRVYQSDWIVENRWEDALTLFAVNENGKPKEQIAYPPTNIVLVAEKQIN
ncbi:MAG: hypothetical protein BRC25_00550 [Parcubacteria group bacterium SW_6_46_9]|nr:MAG: hypothetical protein BRC25_00550 [Parcubacteria group bacterium SW_6_46_9]